MKEYTTIKFDKKEDVGTIWLNRPDIRNAFNETMISELIDVFDEI